MTARFALSILGFVLPALAAGCSAGDGSEGQNADAALRRKPRPVATGDHGAPSRRYPAFTPDIAQLVHQGKGLLRSPNVVTVTWAGDPNAAVFEEFGDRIGASEYWRTTVGEYGVGRATSGPSMHVRVTEAPPSEISDTAAEKFIADHVGRSASTGWPAWAPENIYVVYLPESTKLTTGGRDACADQDAYHGETLVGGKNKAIFSIIDTKCHTADMTAVDFGTTSASHEIGEAVTNPHSDDDSGWVGFDAKHLAFEIFQGKQDENGDACEFNADAYTTGGPDLPYLVQRLWSNAEAAAGRAPCVPTNGEANFNVTPLALEDIAVVLPPKRKSTTRSTGYRIGVGQTGTFAVGFYSDKATDPWQLAVVEGDGMSTPSASHLEVSLDKTSGVNGEKAYVTVKVKSQGKGTGMLVTLVSTLAGRAPRYMPVLIGAY